MSSRTDKLPDPTLAPFGSLTGKVAVVTGSSTGIGRAIALEFAAAGADVVVHCQTSVDAAGEVVEAVRALGRRAELLVADVAADERELESFVDQAAGALGGCQIWVNNAGVDLLTGDAARLGFDKKLQRLFEVDVRGTLLLSRAIGKRFAEQNEGVILNIGWDQADRGMEGDSGELFAASKNAIMGFTRSLAVSLAPSVRVNCIAAGWIRTAWGEQASDDWQARVFRETPLGRWGTPVDIAKAARFLVSPDAAFITGQVINVNGGAIR